MICFYVEGHFWRCKYFLHGVSEKILVTLTLILTMFLICSTVHKTKFHKFKTQLGAFQLVMGKHPPHLVRQIELFCQNVETKTKPMPHISFWFQTPVLKFRPLGMICSLKPTPQPPDTSSQWPLPHSLPTYLGVMLEAVVGRFLWRPPSLPPWCLVPWKPGKCSFQDTKWRWGVERRWVL